jgi:hypothetical protein
MSLHSELINLLDAKAVHIANSYHFAEAGDSEAEDTCEKIGALLESNGTLRDTIYKVLDEHGLSTGDLSCANAIAKAVVELITR